MTEPRPIRAATHPSRDRFRAATVRERQIEPNSSEARAIRAARHPSRDRKGAETMVETRERPVPLAYLITFSCYGVRLHGDEKGSVDRRHNLPGTPFVSPDVGRVRREARTMVQAAYCLDAPRRACVLNAVQGVCAARDWKLLAAHVRADHVHVVVTAYTSPEKAMNAFKTYASRRLNEARFEVPGTKRWTRHGSTKYLWKHEAVERAVAYVVEEQGEPMAVFDVRRG